MDDQGKCQGKVSFNRLRLPDDKRWTAAAEAAAAKHAKGQSAKPCTCHPDDNPPVPCPRKYALHECIAAAYPSNWRPGPLTYDGLRHTHPQFDAEVVRRDIAVLADKIDALTNMVRHIANSVTAPAHYPSAVNCPTNEQNLTTNPQGIDLTVNAAMRAVDKVRR